MKQQFKELLHQYKIDSHRVSHHHNHGEAVDAGTREILQMVEEALTNAYPYHFHQDPDPKRIETFKMIKDYTLEALLPPVLEKLVRRISVLEKNQELIVKLLHDTLEILSDETKRLDPAPERA